MLSILLGLRIVSLTIKTPTLIVRSFQNPLKNIKRCLKEG